MSFSVFSDKTIIPDFTLLSEVLGNSINYWDEIKNSIEGKYGGLVEEWKFYGQKSGWSCKLLLKKRNLLFFVPHKDYFGITFIFGDKAVEEIEQSSLPKNIVKELVDAKKYAEGRGININVNSHNDAENIIKLINIKINN